MTRHSEIGDDLLSSDDLNEIVEEWEDELESLKETDNYYEEEEEEGEKFETDEVKEIKVKIEEANAILDEVDFGETLIHESYFEQYAMEIAEDLGMDTDSWPYTCIDWCRAANDLKSDYTCHEIDGHTYYSR